MNDIKTLVLDLREVPGHPGLSVSRSGQIRRADDHRVVPWENSGYLRFKYQGDAVLVHRALALAWIPNPDGLSDINHKDGNRLNNDIQNLEWCTRRQNVHHAMRSGHHPNPEKAVVGWNPDTNHGWWFISQSAAHAYGFTQANVSKVLRGLRTKCKGYLWEFA